MEPKSELTYGAEGTDAECCRMHWPGGASGVTVGHGYDLGHRDPQAVSQDLKKALIWPEGTMLLTACGLIGREAQSFVAEFRNSLVLDRQQMVLLFNISFCEQENVVKRICAKGDCVEAYGPVDLRELDHRIWLVLVDLKFRGDYTPRARRRIQPMVVANDFPKFREAMKDRDFWHSVPVDRFNRRNAFLSVGLE